MNDPLQKIESLKNLTLSQTEKSEMFSYIQNHMHKSLKQPISSPFNVFSFIHHHGIYTTSFAIALLIAASSVAAETALPGDLLYPIKRNMNENIMQVFALDTETKAETQIKLVERRLKEAEKVIARNPKDNDALAALATDIQDHATEALEHIEDVQINDSIATAVELSNDLDTVIITYDSYIDTVTQEESDVIVMSTSEETATMTTMGFSRMTATDTEDYIEEKISNLQSVLEETHAKVEITTDTLSSIIISSEERLVTEKQISNNKQEIAEILENPALSEKTKAEIKTLVDTAEKVIRENDLNNAFILLEEAEKIAEREIKN